MAILLKSKREARSEQPAVTLPDRKHLHSCGMRREAGHSGIARAAAVSWKLVSVFEVRFINTAVILSEVWPVLWAKLSRTTCFWGV
jgi:hypothetical protein